MCEVVQNEGFRGDDLVLLIQGMKMGGWSGKYTEDSGSFEKWEGLKSRVLKKGGMCPPTYLFRRSLRLDRLGRDCPKLTSDPDFGIRLGGALNGKWLMGVSSQREMAYG